MTQTARKSTDTSDEEENLSEEEENLAQEPEEGKATPHRMLGGVAEVEGEVVDLLRRTASDAVRATGAVATDALMVVEDVGHGVLHGVADLGGEAGTLVRQALDGTVETVGSVGTHVVGSARGLLVEAASGVKEIFTALLPQREHHAAE